MVLSVLLLYCLIQYGPLKTSISPRFKSSKQSLKTMHESLKICSFYILLFFITWTLAFIFQVRQKILDPENAVYSHATPSSTTVHSTEATIPPLSTLGSVVRESADQPSAVPRALDNADNTNRLQAGHRPGQLLPRRKTKPTVDFEDVDTKELFPEGRIYH